MNTYVFQVDISYGIEESYQAALSAENMKEAVLKLGAIRYAMETDGYDPDELQRDNPEGNPYTEEEIDKRGIAMGIWDHCVEITPEGTCNYYKPYHPMDKKIPETAWGIQSYSEKLP